MVYLSIASATYFSVPVLQKPISTVLQHDSSKQPIADCCSIFKSIQRNDGYLLRTVAVFSGVFNEMMGAGVEQQQL